jgi:hypothetical protein
VHTCCGVGLRSFAASHTPIEAYRALIDDFVDQVDRVPRAVASPPVVTVVDSTMVGDLRMWLYRATPGNPRQMRMRRPISGPQLRAQAPEVAHAGNAWHPEPGTPTPAESQPRSDPCRTVRLRSLGRNEFLARM